MNPARTQSRRRRRTWIAVAAALCIHAVLLGAMGLVRPQLTTPLLDDRSSMELQLLPPLTQLGQRLGGASPRAARLVVQAEAVRASPLAGLAEPPPSPAVVDAAERPPVQTGRVSAPFPGFFNGSEPGCGLEDLPLLTGEETVRCRNQIESAHMRQAEAAADAERAARIAAMRALPKVDAIAPEKRAYYDAVAAAAQAVRENFTMPGLPRSEIRSGKSSAVNVGASVHCSASFDTALGKLHCPLAPPTGFLTEEARVAPP